jgi:hypothetical protein
MKLTTHVHKAQWLRRETMPAIPLYAYLKRAETDFTFTARFKWLITLSND